MPLMAADSAGVPPRVSDAWGAEASGIASISLESGERAVLTLMLCVMVPQVGLPLSANGKRRKTVTSVMS
jgi:hypothetical protein